MQNKAEPQNNSANEMLNRARELNNQGMDWSQAWNISFLEDRLSRWPEKWGNNLQILVYGDFTAPESEINIPELGIIIHPGNQKNTIIKSAMTVVKASVSIKEKSIPAIIEATRRINVFLSA